MKCLVVSCILIAYLIWLRSYIILSEHFDNRKISMLNFPSVSSTSYISLILHHPYSKFSSPTSLLCYIFLSFLPFLSFTPTILSFLFQISVTNSSSKFQWIFIRIIKSLGTPKVLNLYLYDPRIAVYVDAYLLHMTQH